MINDKIQLKDHEMLRNVDTGVTCETLAPAIQRMIGECLRHAPELRKRPQVARVCPGLAHTLRCGPQEAFPHVSHALVSRS